MRTFRSMLRIRRKTKSDRILHGTSKTLIEGLERRLLLSAAVDHALEAKLGNDSLSAIVAPATHTMHADRTESRFMLLSSTVTDVTANVPDSAYGAGVILSAQVTPGATGTVFFTAVPVGSSTGTSVGTATISGSTGLATMTFGTTNLPPGIDDITATYSTDGVYASSSGNESSPGAMNNPVEITQVSVSSSAPTGAPLGSPVTLTATVVPASATGTIQFEENGSTPIGSVLTLSGTAPNTASVMTSTLSAGMPSIQAIYNPANSNVDAAAIGNYIQTIDSVGTDTATAALSAPSSAPYGQAVSFLATIDGESGDPTPTGTVDFSYGGNVIGSGTLTTQSAGVATTTFTTVSPSPLPAGSDMVTCTYEGDSNYASGAQSNVSVDVGMVTSTPTLGEVPMSSVSGTSVTFTATVPTVGIGAAPTGTVDFDYGGFPIGSGTLSGNQASFSTSSLTVGMDAITANYLGDGNYSSSMSTSVTEDVSTGGTTASTISLATPPTASYGGPVSLTATVTGQMGIPPTGNVTFSYLGTQIGTATLSGTSPYTATYTGTPAIPLPAGMDTITASYAGDINYAPAAPSATAVQTVTQVTPTTTVTAMPGSSSFGQFVTFTATVAAVGNGVAPMGSVSFYYQGNPIGMGNLSGSSSDTATFTTSSPLPVGTDDITAAYGGDSNYTLSTSVAAMESVSPLASTTTISTSDPMSVPLGTSLTFNVTVSAPVGSDPTPTGTVTFTDNGSQLGSPLTLSGGMASLTTASLGIGPNVIGANYNSGGVGYTNSTTGIPTLTETVTPAVATVTVTPSASSAPYLSTVTLTAVVSSSGSGLPAPTGTVTFMDTFMGVATMLGTMPVTLSATAPAMATLNISSLAVGNHSITVVYSGDSNYGGLPSAAVPLTITPAVTSTTLVSLNNPILFNGFTQFTATVTPMITGGPALTGSVTFYNNGVALGAAIPLSAGGTAQYNTMTLPVGADAITATYSGDMNYLTSMTVMPVTENVGVDTTTTFLTALPTSAALGGSVTLTASISPASATGTVNFYSGTNLLNATPVTVMAGMAVLVTTMLQQGSNSITADYSGSMNDAGSNSTAVTVAVSSATDATALTATPATVAAGSPVTFTATVTPTTTGTPTPTGTVAFVEDGTTTLGTAPLSGTGVAVFTSSTLALGTDTVVATYNGDSNYQTSTSTSVSETVTAVNTNTSATTLASSVNPSAPGESVTFTATVAPSIGNGTPTGSVTFYDGTTALGNAVSLTNGVAVFSTTLLPTGTDYITATYNGGNFSASTSAPVAQVVGTAANFDATLTVSNNSVIIGTPVTLVATITPAMSGGAAASGGTVTFFDGTTSLGAIPLLTNGTAAITVTLAAGAHPITAAYTVGSSQSASTPITVTINSPTIPSIDGLELPPDVVAGLTFPAKVPVLLANVGPKLKGTFIINLFANTGTTLDGSQVLVASMSKKLTLNSDQSRTLNAKLKLFPASLPAGTYNILVQVIDPNGASNLGRSIQTVGVLTPYVSLGPTVGAVTPATIAVGKSGYVDVTVTNNGDEPVSGVLDLTLSPSTTGVSPVAGITLATLNAKVKFQAGQTRRYRLHFTTAALSAGDYQPYLAVSLAGYTATTVGPATFTVD